MNTCPKYKLQKIKKKEECLHPPPASVVEMMARAKKTAAVRYMILVAMRKRMLPFVFVFFR